MQDEKIQGKGHLIAFLLLCCTSLLLGVIDLNLPVWLSYCWWNIGLVDAQTNSRIIEFSDENTISDVKSDACGSLKTLVERSCPNACSYIDNFEKAGITMIVFGVISLIFMSITITISVMRLCKMRVKKSFIVVCCLPFVFWLFGFSVYAGIAGLGRMDSSVNKPEFNFVAKDYQMKVGIAISITILLLDLGIALYGMLKIKDFLQFLVIDPTN